MGEPGTGSSAFRDLLPHVVGTDTSSKTRNATETYCTNLSNIDNSFASVLQDLAEQKKKNEEALLTGIEQQRQGVQSQIGQNQAQLSAARGGDYAAQRAAGADSRNAINNSRNLVESFSNTYRTPYTHQSSILSSLNTRPTEPQSMLRVSRVLIPLIPTLHYFGKSY